MNVPEIEKWTVRWRREVPVIGNRQLSAFFDRPVSYMTTHFRTFEPYTLRPFTLTQDRSFSTGHLGDLTSKIKRRKIKKDLLVEWIERIGKMKKC